MLCNDILSIIIHKTCIPIFKRVCRGRVRMVAAFMVIYAISAYHHQCCCGFESLSGEVYSMQYYVIKFVSDLWQVVDFLRVFQFPPTIKLTATI